MRSQCLGDFPATDDRAGEKLGPIRLDDVPSASPVSCSVDEKQYIAIVSGGGSLHATMLLKLVPEIKNPPNRSSTVWIF